MSARPIPADQVENDTRAIESVHARLEPIWRNKPGFWGWLTSVNHKSIALRSIITAFVFFALGGVEAALMRMQLARPENSLIGPDRYNQIFTVHGSDDDVPVRRPGGAVRRALPRADDDRHARTSRSLGSMRLATGRTSSAVSLLYVGLFTNTGPDQGWFSYPPLAGPEFSPGKRVDIWAQMITFTEIAAIVAAIEIIATVFKQRAPGMSLNRVPLFVWAMVDHVVHGADRDALSWPRRA